MMRQPFWRAVSSMATMRHGRPNTWTGRTARVARLAAAATRSGSGPRLSSSMSTNLGTAPS